jgi:hypothetical protein
MLCLLFNSGLKLAPGSKLNDVVHPASFGIFNSATDKKPRRILPVCAKEIGENDDDGRHARAVTTTRWMVEGFHAFIIWHGSRNGYGPFGPVIIA